MENDKEYKKMAKGSEDGKPSQGGRLSGTLQTIVKKVKKAV